MGNLVQAGLQDPLPTPERDEFPENQSD